MSESNKSLQCKDELNPNCLNCEAEMDMLDVNNSDNNLCFKCRYKEIGTDW